MIVGQHRYGEHLQRVADAVTQVQDLRHTLQEINRLDAVGREEVKEMIDTLYTYADQMHDILEKTRAATIERGQDACVALTELERELLDVLGEEDAG
jgi:spore cortex formation protein SpoVR/YcgB (stage V sporulation)